MTQNRKPEDSLYVEAKKNFISFWPLVSFLIIHSVALIIWGTNLTHDVSALKDAIVEKTDDRYRGSDAARDLALRDEKIESLKSRVDDNDKRTLQQIMDLSAGVQRLEAKLDKYIFNK